jgi:hypothetical protein
VRAIVGGCTRHGVIAWLLAASQALAQAPLPAQTLLLKGAWSSASDSVTPVPEGGTMSSLVYSNEYFGLTYPLPTDWTEKYKGPPPSDSGYYVLAQLLPAEGYRGKSRGTLLIIARDLFFTPMPASSALELVNDTRDHLGASDQVEQAPEQVTIHGRSFVRFGYGAPSIGLHRYVLATEIRCHVVQFVYTSPDVALIKQLVHDFGKVTLPTPEAAPSDNVPLCLSDYATAANVLERVEPELPENRFNPIPVRVIIDKDGKVKHIHFLSAFPSESTAITSALMQWRFKPYLREGHPVEVETGIMFGRAPLRAQQSRR